MASGDPLADDPAAMTLTPLERGKMLALYAGILATTVFAFLAAFAYLPHHFQGETSGGALIFSGVAITAYILGIRHGFDADHIAAIDNVTRKLLNERKRPLTVGTWFSLGHSTIVFVLVAGLVVASEYFRSHLAIIKSAGAVVGTLISGTFLFIIGLVNVIIVLDVYRLFKGLRDQELDQAALDDQMNKRGFLNRYFGALFKVVQKPWQIYPIGVLFGLGFDTATEVFLIGFIVVFAATTAVPLWAVMVLPLLFTCGMVLADTTDGFAMRYAYGWAFLKPIRKVYYNLTLTIISVLVAFAIGGVELLQVVSGEFGWSGPFWTALDGVDFTTLGFGIVVLFVASWLIAMGIYRYKRYEEIGFAPPPRPAI